MGSSREGLAHRPQAPAGYSHQIVSIAPDEDEYCCEFAVTGWFGFKVHGMRSTNQIPFHLFVSFGEGTPPSSRVCQQIGSNSVAQDTSNVISITLATTNIISCYMITCIAHILRPYVLYLNRSYLAGSNPNRR